MIASLYLNDYYVVIDILETGTQLDAIRAAILDNDDFRQRKEKLLSAIDAQEIDGIAKIVERGAQLCGIDAATRDEIYSPFRIQPKIQVPGKGSKVPYQLLFGGRLNENQAETVAEFLRGIIGRVPALRGKVDPNRIHIARMSID